MIIFLNIEQIKNDGKFNFLLNPSIIITPSHHFFS